MAALSKLSEEKKATLAWRICLSEMLFMMGMSVVVPTRAPLVVAALGGDALAAANLLGSWSAGCAAVELFLNPLLGSLSDIYGRKPFMVLACVVNGCLHTSVGLFPNNLFLNG